MSVTLGFQALTQLKQLKQLQEKIDARILRERALIFLSAVAVLFMLWNFIIQAPIDNKLQAAQLQLTDVNAQRTAAQTQITAATQALLSDPNRLKKAQITQLQADIAAVDAQLQNTSQSLINAEQLPQVLQDVLQKTSQLTLLEVVTLPAEELHIASADELSVNKDTKVSAVGGEKTGTNSIGIYQHTVELRVAGNYFQVIQFLRALEGLPWRFYWKALDYHVMEYPNAEIILRVYTLSSEEGLLGV